SPHLHPPMEYQVQSSIIRPLYYRQSPRGFQVIEDLGQSWNNLKKIINDAVVRHLENRSFRILINGDDTPGCLHTHQMLNGSRNPHGNVQLWGNRPPGTADLVFPGQPFRVNDGPGRTDRAANRLRQIKDDLEILLLLQPAPTGND